MAAQAVAARRADRPGVRFGSAAAHLLLWLAAAGCERSSGEQAGVIASGASASTSERLATAAPPASLASAARSRAAEPAPTEATSDGELPEVSPSKLPERPRPRAGSTPERSLGSVRAPPPPPPERLAAPAPPPVAAAPSSTAPPRPLAPVRGPRVEGEGFAAWLGTTGGYRVGAASSVRATVEANAPFKCNEQYPHKFALDGPPAGLSFPQPVVRQAAVTQRRTTIEVPFRVDRAGKYRVSGVLSFSVCTDDRCLVERRPLSVVVEARD